MKKNIELKDLDVVELKKELKRLAKRHKFIMILKDSLMLLTYIVVLLFILDYALNL